MLETRSWFWASDERCDNNRQDGLAFPRKFCTVACSSLLVVARKTSILCVRVVVVVDEAYGQLRNN